VHQSKVRTTNAATICCIYLIPKWLPLWYSFVFLQITPGCLILELKVQKNISLEQGNKGLFARKQKHTKMAAILE